MIYKWAISIVGAICLTAMVDVIMSDGETKKYTKSILSVIVFAVVISPIFTLVNREISFESMFNTNTSETTLNVEYLSDVNKKKIDDNEKSLEKTFEEMGYSGVAININYYEENYGVVVTSVVVSNTREISKDIVISTIERALNVDEDKILIME